ncbi:transglutaminase-like domain-containing protein [Kitasatospora sp. NPDC088134]|uniref:transglutaminase-like domain-containing protein n=1 Tax=Kitasatospora sp. NPDC088134 TaxID=3364071 RepID=UPI003801F13E
MPTVRPAPDAAAFYTAQSAFSDPGEFAAGYAGLPTGPRELAAVVRGLMLHRREVGRFGPAVPPEHLREDAEARYLDAILRVLLGRSDAPLTRRRAAGERFVGVCRDFALLHCSLLRHAGVPARLRCGFAGYLGPAGFHTDHVVTEYWDAGRGWLLADPELADPAVAEALGVDFDPLDVPRDRFLVAGEVWRAVRAGSADPAVFGLRPGDPRSGEWFVAGGVRLDLAALNKVETLLWDVWGAAPDHDGAATDGVRELYDRAAAVTAGQVPFGAARELFDREDGLRTPRTVRSLAAFGGPREVVLR